jgi:hypothetical protein
MGADMAPAATAAPFSTLRRALVFLLSVIRRSPDVVVMNMKQDQTFLNFLRPAMGGFSLA